ncbi:uncharacterized protein CTRU02_215685 [Colletotrichum truncatum]|uniref:Uncharacterized protein n=1 Tax=Colletotrichum truncatum TaxID=5467 RepID=A0ACC3YBW5_COLTU|nr:uncharacterized protein CTRU02_15118 [Colletotrichum truncatum]KAF6781411.1 hypothetical protein CTRU02_15118 [Colletotrichum truncatum]
MTSLERRRGLQYSSQLRASSPQNPSFQLLTKNPDSMRRKRRSF